MVFTDWTKQSKETQGFLNNIKSLLNPKKRTKRKHNECSHNNNFNAGCLCVLSAFSILCWITASVQHLQEKVEIDPVTNQKASTKFWIGQKPISMDSDHLCACDLVEERSPSKWLLLIVTFVSNEMADGDVIRGYRTNHGRIPVTWCINDEWIQTLITRCAL